MFYNYDESFVKKNAPNKFLSRQQLELKVTSIQRERKSLLQSRVRLENKISEFIRKESQKVDKETDNIIKEVLEKNDSGFDEDSPKYLLWEQQKLMAKQKKKSSMRLLIKLVL